MIEQDLLGISVNDLINNYCVLYDKEQEKGIGITSIEIAEDFDKIYGNDYEDKYVFVDIFAIDLETVQQNKILSFFDVEQELKEFIGWKPSPEMVGYMAACMHEQWVDVTKNSAQLLLDLLKVITANQELIKDTDVIVIHTIKEQIDQWRKNWCSYWALDDSEQKNKHVKVASEILEKLHKECEEDDNW